MLDHFQYIKLDKSVTDIDIYDTFFKLGLTNNDGYFGEA